MYVGGQGVAGNISYIFFKYMYLKSVIRNDMHDSNTNTFKFSCMPKHSHYIFSCSFLF